MEHFEPKLQVASARTKHLFCLATFIDGLRFLQILKTSRYVNGDIKPDNQVIVRSGDEEASLLFLCASFCTSFPPSAPCHHNPLEPSDPPELRRNRSHYFLRLPRSDPPCRSPHSTSAEMRATCENEQGDLTPASFSYPTDLYSLSLGVLTMPWDAVFTWVRPPHSLLLTSFSCGQPLSMRDSQRTPPITSSRFYLLPGRASTCRVFWVRPPKPPSFGSCTPFCSSPATMLSVSALRLTLSVWYVPPSLLPALTPQTEFLNEVEEFDGPRLLSAFRNTSGWRLFTEVRLVRSNKLCFSPCSPPQISAVLWIVIN